MSHYRRNNDSNRDALFGPGPSSNSSKVSSSSRRKPVSRAANTANTAITSNVSASPANTSANASATTRPMVSARTTRTDTSRRQRNGPLNILTGSAKLEKLKEAESYREKAKKAMTKTLFSKQDPIAAAMFYHRAAEAYKLCGENRLERLHRIASGDCQMGHGAYASAAGEFTRAAELSENSEETVGRKQKECCKLYADAAKAWREIGELGRAGECDLKSAFSLLIGDDEEDDEDVKLMSMNKKALELIELAIENHVPDPLNRYASFRQTGTSAYLPPDSDNIDQSTKDICAAALITTSYAHETIFKALYKLLHYGEYASALYAAGAASTVLEADSFVSLTLSRAYAVETILALALGDVVAADKFFLQVHLQKNSYLSSRECKLAEDLIRAVKMRDVDALEEARSPVGSNRAALSNLNAAVRSLVQGLRVSGLAKKSAASGSAVIVKSQVSSKVQSAPAPSLISPSAPSSQGTMDRDAKPRNLSSMQPKSQHSTAMPSPAKSQNLNDNELQTELNANFAELDELMNDMGLNSDDDGAGNEQNDDGIEEEDIDDDDIDLR